jgi:carbon-monoxide dehydrogenase large subunit
MIIEDQAAGSGNPRPAAVSRPDAADLVQGRGEFFGDIDLPGTAHVALVRSPHPHARIISVDTNAALAHPGVLDVVSGADLADSPEIPHNVDPVGVGGQHVHVRPLAHGKAVYAGEPVAAVVGETPGDAAAGAARVQVTYEPLPFVLDAAEARAEGAPRVIDEWTTNVIVSGQAGSGEAEAAMARAAQVISGELSMHRSTSAPLETRGYLAQWNRRSGRLTFWGTANNPHPLRAELSQALGVPESKIRVIAPRAGGSFGLKMHGHPEEVLVCILARRLGRPVRWTEDRAHCMLIGAREHTITYQAGFDPAGRVTALKADVVSNLGAPAGLPGWGMSLVGTLALPNGYDITDCALTWTAVATNKAPWNGARGYGKELAAVLMERIMDRVAASTGVDPAEVRRRNWVRADQFPHSTATGLQLDSGDYHALLDRVLAAADYKQLKESAPSAPGRLRGLGLSFEIVPESVDLPGSLVSGSDTTAVRMDPQGNVTVLTGVTSPGSGSDRGIAQLVARILGIDPDAVTVIQGDTDLCPYGYGNLSARSLVAGGGAAVLAAEDIAAKLKIVAAAMLHAPESFSPGNVVLSGGMAAIPATAEPASADQVIPIPVVANAVHTLAFIVGLGIDPALESVRTYRPGNIRHFPDASGHINPFSTYSNAVHLSVVEIEPDTGVLHLMRHLVAHDCGTVVNAALVEGQVRGAVAMCLGTIRGEHLSYGTDGRPRAAGFKTYLTTRAPDLPRIEVLHQETPSPFTFNGAKGGGEVGVGGAMAAVLNAVNDALAPLGASVESTPLDPPRLLSAIKKAKK